MVINAGSDFYSKRISKIPLFQFVFEAGQFVNSVNSNNNYDNLKTFDSSGRNGSNVILSYIDFNLQYNENGAYYNSDKIGIYFPTNSRSNFTGRSQPNVTKLAEAIVSAGGFTIELWMLSENVWDTIYYHFNDCMMGFTNGDSDFPNGLLILQDSNYNGNNDLDLLLSFLSDSVQMQNSLVSITELASSFTPNSSPPQSFNISHIVVAYNSSTGTTNFYVNGNPSNPLNSLSPFTGLTRFYNEMVSSVNTTTSYFRVGECIDVFPNAASIPAFQGSIFVSVMYDAVLSSKEVMQNYLAGLPNSRPVGVDSVQSIFENMLSPLYLAVSDFDGNDIVNMSIIILSIPSNGKLFYRSRQQQPQQLWRLISNNDLPFQLNATIVNVNDTSFSGESNYNMQMNMSLWFVSNVDEYGDNYGEISYVGFDGIVESNTITATINIIRVNLPPTVTQATTTQKILCNSLLSPIDIVPVDDPANQIVAIHILSLPNYGQLYYSNSLLTQAMIPFTIANSSLNDNGVDFRLYFTPSPCLIASPQEPQSKGVIFSDSFNISVSDDSPFYPGGLTSSPITISIAISNSLLAVNENVTGQENSLLPIFLNGRNLVQTANGNITFVITSLPSNGILYNSNMVQISGNNNYYPVSNRTVFYSPNKDHFSINNFDSFAFIVSINNSSSIRYFDSPPATITISILPINLPQTLSYCNISSICPPLLITAADTFIPLNPITFDDPDVSIAGESPASNCYLLQIYAYPSSLAQIQLNLSGQSTYPAGEVALPISGTGYSDSYFAAIVTYNEIQDYLSPLQYRTLNLKVSNNDNNNNNNNNFISGLGVTIVVSDVNFYNAENDGANFVPSDIPSSCVLKPSGDKLYSTVLVIPISKGKTPPTTSKFNFAALGQVKTAIILVSSMMATLLFIFCVILAFQHHQRRKKQMQSLQLSHRSIYKELFQSKYDDNAGVMLHNLRSPLLEFRSLLWEDDVDECLILSASALTATSKGEKTLSNSQGRTITAASEPLLLSSVFIRDDIARSLIYLSIAHFGDDGSGNRSGSKWENQLLRVFSHIWKFELSRYVSTHHFHQQTQQNQIIKVKKSSFKHMAVHCFTSSFFEMFGLLFGADLLEKGLCAIVDHVILTSETTNGIEKLLKDDEILLRDWQETVLKILRLFTLQSNKHDIGVDSILHLLPTSMSFYLDFIATTCDGVVEDNDDNGRIAIGDEVACLVFFSAYVCQGLKQAMKYKLTKRNINNATAMGHLLMVSKALECLFGYEGKDKKRYVTKQEETLLQKIESPAIVEEIRLFCQKIKPEILTEIQTTLRNVWKVQANTNNNNPAKVSSIHITSELERDAIVCICHALDHDLQNLNTVLLNANNSGIVIRIQDCIKAILSSSATTV